MVSKYWAAIMVTLAAVNDDSWTQFHGSNNVRMRVIRRDLYDHLILQLQHDIDAANRQLAVEAGKNQLLREYISLLERQLDREEDFSQACLRQIASMELVLAAEKRHMAAIRRCGACLSRCFNFRWA